MKVEDAITIIKNMKEKNKIFFGEQGITSTSANHIANMAKEYVQHLQDEDTAIGFLDCKVSLMTSNESKVIAHGMKSDILKKIPENLQKITEANSLIAWLREAIKAKESEMDEVAGLDYYEYLKAEHIDYPECPEKENYDFVEFGDVLATLSAKERMEYYELETKCAVIGKFIHPGGSYAKARKELKYRVLHPISVQGEGQQAMIYEYFPSIQVNEMEDLFFNLQNEHRSAQASLNAIKFKIQQQVDDTNQKEHSRLSADTAAYTDTHKNLQIDFNAYKEQKRAELSKPKIIIPNSLTGIFEILNKIGK